MRFYRVHLIDDTGESRGTEWFADKSLAERHLAEFLSRHYPDRSSRESELSAVDIEPTDVGILRALRRYADHPDNG